MGEPAELTDNDRDHARYAAAMVVRSIEEGVYQPIAALEAASRQCGEPVQMLILWLAQVAREHFNAVGMLRESVTFSNVVADAQARAREARAMYGKPSKATRVRIERGDFVRVSGLVLCEVCQVEYSDHDPVIGYPWLRHGCDGRLLKP